MKKSKRVSVALSSILLAGICSFGLVQAASGSFTKVSYSNIPGGGNCKVNLTTGNVKATSGQTASFKMDSGNFLRINSRLIFSNQDLASDAATAPGNKDTIVTASERDKVYQGGTYYNRTCSHAWEGSNSSSPDIWFSADNLQ